MSTEPAVHPYVADRCTCPRVMVGTRPVDARHLHPYCPVHGDEARRREGELLGQEEAKRGR